MILFDLDGTLVDARLAQATAYAEALERTFGTPLSLDSVKHQGATLRMILDLLRGEEATSAERARFVHAHADALQRALSQSGALIPGVLECLSELKRTGEPLGVITGNSEMGTNVALEHFGLSRFFDVGYFGDEMASREDLVAAATSVLPNQIVVGDTPLDVIAGKAHDCGTVAVATGDFSLEALAETGPDLLFSTLREAAPQMISLRMSRV